MSRAPLLGRLLLRLAARRADHEAVAGELLAEYLEFQLPARGERAARRWYMGQAARSAWPLLRLRASRWRPGAALFRAQLLVAVPLLLLHVLWSTVLSGVPLRADALSPGFAAASAAIIVAAVMIGTWITGARFGGVGPAPVVMAATVSMVTALLTAPALISRFASPSLLVIALPLAVLIAASLRTLLHAHRGAGRTS